MLRIIRFFFDVNNSRVGLLYYLLIQHSLNYKPILNVMKDFLFPKPTESKGFSLLLLCLRILFGLMLITHGIDKLLNYTELNFVFPDPMGIGTEVSLILVLFGELFCAIAFIFGAIYRLSMIPMIIVMLVAFFHIHQGNILQGELAFIYLIVFVIMYIAGPGQYSIDAKIYQYIHAKDYEAYEY
jgi:putative oxidoreductase